MITLAYSLSVLLMILFPVALAVALRRRVQVPWFLFLVGTATFIGSQAVHLPLNHWLTDLGVLPHSMLEGRRWQTALLMGLTAGLCEETARAVGYALLRRWRRFEDGLMMGLGHGGIEAMIFGGVLTAATLSSLMALSKIDPNTLHLSADQLAAVNRQLAVFTVSPFYAALPLVERILAVGLHVTLSLLVWRAFERRNPLYFVLAISYHMVVDAAAVTAAQYELSGITVELGLLAMLAPGVLWVWLSRPRSLASHPVAPASMEWRTFVAAVRKEWLQQWRTKRLLVMLAVFVLFGLTSPLLAYFTPQMLKMVPGTEQFAALVPTPTAADAMAQYVKNLTQFGFMLAVLLGMGAVAGEKERGTAALILSKPLPRWAFVLSKFTAQMAGYSLGFVLAALGAFYYTLFLFGPVDFGSFMLSNLLLLLWLLVFVAVALLGSTLGGSTGAAAGIGLGGAVVLLLAGNLPQVGPLMPNGLIAWASQIGLGTSGSAAASNGGAVAAALTLIVLCLLGALAAFERQEL